MHMIFRDRCEDVAQLKQKYKQVIRLIDEQLKESYTTKLVKPWGLLKHIPHTLQKYKCHS